MRVTSDGRIYGTTTERLESRIWAKPGCWEWLGAHFQNKGYALFNHRNAEGKWIPTVAHRVVYETFVGPIPDGYQIDHLCRNHGCVNPNHLEAVTPRENNLRGIGPAAREAKQTHCLRGHPFKGENLYLKPNGKRECRICQRLREARRRPRKGVGQDARAAG